VRMGKGKKDRVVPPGAHRGDARLPIRRNRARPGALARPSALSKRSRTAADRRCHPLPHPRPGSPTREDRQARYPARAATLLRRAPSGKRSLRPPRPGTPRTRQARNHPALPARRAGEVEGRPPSLASGRAQTSAPPLRADQMETASAALWNPSDL
jgi:hypothetical protein